MGNDVNKHTRETILNRRDALLRERRSIRENRQALAQRDREIDRELADCRAAARLFDLTDIEFPPDEREEYMRIRAIENRLIHGARETAHVIDTQPSLSLTPEIKSISSPKEVRRQMPRIKDIVLDCLKAAGPEGTKAAKIKRYIESTYLADIHEKTVGMTLYRLSQSKEKPVRREGQTWFFVPSKAETKNPGVDAPGHINRGN